MHPFDEYILESTGCFLLSPRPHPEASSPTPSQLQPRSTPKRPPPTSSDIPPASSLPLSPELQPLKNQVLSCTHCALHQGKTNYVFGEGNAQAQLMFIGEGPGQDEDRTGRPFVGRAGQLLTKIIQAMKLERKDVYIGNVVKCRPPNNRAPLPDEAARCILYLYEQIRIIQPKVIVLLGATAATHLMGTKIPISKVRGQWTEVTLPTGESFKTMPTYHPAALLRNPILKKEVWEDMKKVMVELGMMA